MPLLRNPDKSKLSKRKNPVWASWYKEQGFLPEAVRNYLATMAWAHPVGKEIFTTEDMIQVFSLEKIQTTAPIFDPEKLRWMNGEYLRQKSDSQLQQLITDYYQHDVKVIREQASLLPKIIPLIRERIKTLAEFWNLAGFFFEAPAEYERPIDHKRLQLVRTALVGDDWNHDAMEHSIRKSADDAGEKAKDLFMELRVAVTGKTVGPPLLESLEILGKEDTMRRLTILSN